MLTKVIDTLDARFFWRLPLYRPRIKRLSISRQYRENVIHWSKDSKI